MQSLYIQDHQPFPYSPVDTFSHVRLSDIESLSQVLSLMQQLQDTYPQEHFLCTLDDVNQCCYTSMHASEDDLLYVASDDVDFDDQKSIHAYELRKLNHIVTQLNTPTLQVKWANVIDTLGVATEDFDALIEINRRPDRVLDDIVYIQRLPVSSNTDLIAGLPNGYFSCDWNIFQNHAIIRHMAQQHQYRFFGIGASWLGFVRDKAINTLQAHALAADVIDLYGLHDHAKTNNLKVKLVEIFEASTVLLLGYTETFRD